MQELCEKQTLYYDKLRKMAKVVFTAVETDDEKNTRGGAAGGYPQVYQKRRAAFPWEGSIRRGITRTEREGEKHMTLKELSQLYYLGKEIEADRQRLCQLRLKVPALSGRCLSEMPKSRNQDSRVESYIAEIVDLESVILEKMTECVHERNRLERYIAEIPDSLTRQIFTHRFIHGMSWQAVAHSVGGWNTADSVRKICRRYIDHDNKN